MAEGFGAGSLRGLERGRAPRVVVPAPDASEAATLSSWGVHADPGFASVWARDGGLRALGRRPYATAVGLGVAMAATALLVAAATGLPFRDPDRILGARFGLLVAVTAAFLVLDVAPRAASRVGWRLRGLPTALRGVVRERWSLRRLAYVTTGLVAFYTTYVSYRNLKSFLPFLREQDLDLMLLRLEREVLGGSDPAALLQGALGTGAAAHVLAVTYLFFLAFVPLSLGTSLILSINPVPGLWWVTALGINWTLGTLSYYLLPSLGPVFVAPWLFAELPVTEVAELQRTLLAERRAVLSDPWSTHAVQGIAAFASLHVSIVFSAAVIAHLLRLRRWLRIALWAFLGLTLISTVYFGWHYLVDNLAGLAIGAIAVTAAARATGHWFLLRGATAHRGRAVRA
jgi:membrane-associated phospholipid phosphatase